MNDLPSGRGTYFIKAVYYTDKEGNNLVAKSSGLPKVMMILDVKDMKGRKDVVYEHIVESPSMDWKRELIFKSVGKPHLHVPGKNLNLDQIEGLEGECMIALRNYNGQSQTTISRYYEPKKKEPIVAEEFIDDSLDDLPF